MTFSTEHHLTPDTSHAPCAMHSDMYCQFYNTVTNSFSVNNIHISFFM